MKRLLSISILVALAVLLGGCGFTFLNNQAIVFSADSGTIGYEVDQNGNITIEERTFRFHNLAGGIGATIVGYEVNYFDAGGGLLGSNAGTLSTFVPAGILCDEPDPVRGCTSNSAGAYFTEGPEVVTQGLNILEVGVASAHIAAGFPIGWYAEVRFNGITTANTNFTTQFYQLQIAAPN